MLLTKCLSSIFDPQIRQRGDVYFRQGRVSKIKIESGHISANVKGARLYHLEIEEINGDIGASCTCYYGEREFGLCKHVWALICALELMAPTAPLVRKLASSHNWVTVDEFDDVNESDPSPDSRTSAAPRVAAALTPPKPPSWRAVMKDISESQQEHLANGSGEWPLGRQIIYIVSSKDVVYDQGNLPVEIAYREKKRDGEWSKPHTRRLKREWIPLFDDPDDQQIVAGLIGTGDTNSGYKYGWAGMGHTDLAPNQRLSPIHQKLWIPRMAATGRLFLRHGPDILDPCAWDGGPPWEFRLRLNRAPDGSLKADGAFERGTQVLPVTDAVCITAGGFLFFGGSVAQVVPANSLAWAWSLRSSGEIVIPAKDADAFIESLLASPSSPALDLPPKLKYESIVGVFRPRAMIRKQNQHTASPAHLFKVDVEFDYEGHRFTPADPARGFVKPGARTFVERSAGGESKYMEQLRQMGAVWRAESFHPEPHFGISGRLIQSFIDGLIRENWVVEAEGRTFRSAGSFSLSVRSQIDWFELNGSFDFEGQAADISDVLDAIQRQDDRVVLSDGSVGVVSEDWKKRLGPLLMLGTSTDGTVRFKRSQAALLDALLAAHPKAFVDPGFKRVRRELARFAGVKSLAAHPSFQGTLRGYQKDALGWFSFLRMFGFGGCLADDMGLGKTVVVLAMLAGRVSASGAPSAGVSGAGRINRSRGRPKKAEHSREDNHPRLPSLIVVPRSLIFNWQDEAARFVPGLRILDYTGNARQIPTDGFAEVCDVVLTTYGTLRQDAARLKDIEFDYVILDESQAIKNAVTGAAKASRLINGRHRLALSGTPIENHVGELWSLFEFLNPGILGRAPVFKQALGAGDMDEQKIALISRAVKPFVLRRTKAQVEKDLPKKTEQTLYCDLSPEQRNVYEGIRDHYRRSLLTRLDRDGMNRSRMHVLEALLRLRQAACHPQLIDHRPRTEAGAKLDLLLERIDDIRREGHKALVFSQFTSFLSILRGRLDAARIPYEYLDGKTRDRKRCVERFQTDAGCPLFLISLRAGGNGLNLTAADYVFLLDPWWNPAVEAQAVDRTYRIGQTKPVFAYRIIARETVEEKVLELQKTKRALADSILTADKSLIRNLTRKDLELLLS